MNNREKLEYVLDNLNEEGINFLFGLFNDMDQIEKYNKNTTPERLAELKQIDDQKELQDKKKRLQDEEDRKLKKMEEERKEQELINEHSIFMRNIKLVKTGNYHLTYGEMQTIFLKNEGSMFGVFYDSFRAGFLKGQRSEKARQKRLRKKAKAY